MPAPEADMPDMPGADAVHIDIRRGNPTAEELAAVVAVVTEAYEREAADAVVEDGPLRSAWEVSARGIREPLNRDLGWR